MFILLIICVGLGSYILTAMYRQYALSKNIIDTPNERSSHELPTPRGGGVAIVFAFVIGILFLYYSGFIATFVVVGMLGAGVIVAILGSLDDHIELSAKLRIAGHFIAAMWFLYWIEKIPFEIETDRHGFYVIVSYVVIALYLVWLTNLYNFMDGINGIASIEAITVSCSSAILLYTTGPDDNLWMVTIVLAIAVFGFLVWNFPRAKIFMGDAGSGFLGITFGTLSVYSAGQTPELSWSWLIILGIFFVDATLTLAMRIIRKEIWYQAHRDHAYQHAALRWGHKKISTIVMMINIVWLFPLAYLASIYPAMGLLILIIAYVPLIFTAIIYRAGLCYIKSI